MSWFNFLCRHYLVLVGCSACTIIGCSAFSCAGEHHIGFRMTSQSTGNNITNQMPNGEVLEHVKRQTEKSWSEGSVSRYFH
ncbi:hypothetical protein KP509_15G053000 [Ceratopteris richardii]|uniref:Secreted protein n=1 Tax=Ceratopteris richardii TaxID=49495 RepID=A0A8T2T880_CERRI|nr:hypothetical protein KP509_15G053000 [Ceratopteris richardii]